MRTCLYVGSFYFNGSFMIRKDFRKFSNNMSDYIYSLILLIVFSYNSRTFLVKECLKLKKWNKSEAFK